MYVDMRNPAAGCEERTLVAEDYFAFSHPILMKNASYYWTCTFGESSEQCFANDTERIQVLGDEATGGEY